MRVTRQQRIATESTEEREAACLQQVRVTRQQRIATESTEEREACLQQVRSAQDRRIATESAEEREARLQQLRVAQQQRVSAESAEERVACLQQLRFGQQQRITAESTEEREARLQQVRRAQDRRIATESAEEREARLQQLRVAQQQSIATETLEEIEARRARDRRNHMDLKTAEVPLFQQTRVRFNMRQFHSRLKSVCVPRCVTKVSMHLSISHSLCRRSSRSPIMLSILLVYILLGERERAHLVVQLRLFFSCIIIYIRVVRRALNLLRASFSPIFQYFSAVNVTYVSFSPVFQYFVTYVIMSTYMRYAYTMYHAPRNCIVGHGFFDLEFVRHGFVSHKCRCCCTCR